MGEVRMREYCEIAERLVPRAFRARHSRRSFVMLGNVLAVATIAAVLLDLGKLTMLPGLGASFSCTMFFGAILVPAGAMDQREARIRDGAHRRAYMLGSFLVFPLALLAAAAIGHSDGMQLMWVFPPACLLFWGLPYSIIAWSLPDVTDGLPRAVVTQEDSAVVKAA